MGKFRLIRPTSQVVAERDDENIRKLLDVAFGSRFSEEDWKHTFGGVRFLGYVENQLIAHAAVISRIIQVDENSFDAGYLEGVAVIPSFQGKGYGSQVILEATSFCKSEFHFSMLSKSKKSIYRKFGWLDFCGESFVNKDGIQIRSHEEDQGLMYLTGDSAETFIPTKVVCNSRSGDDW